MMANLNESSTNRPLWPWSLALVMLALGLGWQIWRGTQLHERVRQAENMLNLQADSLQWFAALHEADNLLLSGMKDSALALYQSLSGQSASRDSLLLSRKAQADSLNRPVMVRQASLPTIIVNRADPNFERSVNQDSLLSELATQADRSAKRSDSLQQAMERERENLRRELAANQSKAQWQYLKFKSGKGQTVSYVGEVSGGKANGRGVGIYESGSVYNGEWRNNQRHGQGVFTWADGEKYEGDYHEDMRHGYGIYTWNNGLRYEGQWNKDRREGQGILYDKNNKVRAEGRWVNDKPAK